MFGSNIGQLAVNVKTATRLYHKWHKFGDRGDTWHQATVAIGKHFGFQVVFEVTAGVDVNRDIAIDDVSFSSCLAGMYLVLHMLQLLECLLSLVIVL